MPAEIEASDPELDLAALRMPGADFPVPPLVGEVPAGRAFTALGYPGAARGGHLHALSADRDQTAGPSPTGPHAAARGRGRVRA